MAARSRFRMGIRERAVLLAIIKTNNTSAAAKPVRRCSCAAENNTLDYCWENDLIESYKDIAARP